MHTYSYDLALNYLYVPILLGRLRRITELTWEKIDTLIIIRNDGLTMTHRPVNVTLINLNYE